MRPTVEVVRAAMRPIVRAIVDGELRPVRLDTAGNPRRYDPSIVERVLRDRSK